MLKLWFNEVVSKSKKYPTPLIIIFTLLFLFSLVLIIFNIGKSQDIRQQATGNDDAPCTLLLYTDNESEPMPITGTIETSGAQTVCKGGVEDRYISYYDSRDQAIADKQTAHYPCQEFGTDVGSSCWVNDKVGKKICVGGPEFEYVSCLRTDQTGNYYRILEGPTAVLPDVPPTPTPVVPTATVTPVPNPTHTPTPTNVPTLTHTPVPTNTPAQTPTPTSTDVHWCVEGCIPLSADLNGDGYVDMLDYTIMTNQFYF